MCRVRTQHRLLIRARPDLGWQPVYAGTLVDNDGRPARRRSHGTPLRGQLDHDLTTAPIRLAPLSALGLCELLLKLDEDAELFS